MSQALVKVSEDEMTGKNQHELQREDERERLEQIEVVVELDPSLARFITSEEHDTQTFKNYLQQHMNELLVALSLPIEFSLTVRSLKVSNDSRMLPFNVYISERKCWFPLPASLPQDVTALELARSVAQVIYQNREMCVTTSLAEKIRQKWTAQNDANDLDLKEFHKYLLLLVRRAFSIDRGKKSYSLVKTQQDVRAEYLFEAAVSDITTTTITIFLDEAQSSYLENLPEELHQMRKSLFEELGLILPKVDIATDQSLTENELGIQLNDLRFPPYTLIDTPLWGDETQPIPWRRSSLIISKLTSELRENASFFIVGDSVNFLLQKINSPLKESVQARFEVAELTHILRNLLDEGLSVRDLRSILEALISINGTLTIDQSVFMVFSPATANLCPVIEDKKLADLDSSDYASFVRIALKRYISHKYAGESNNLLVFLLAPEIKTRIKLADKQPLTDQEWGQLIDAVLDAFERPKPSDGNVVILTTFDIRKRLRNLLEKSFPRLAVLSQQELMPDINIQPLGQIFWT
jgi:FHIPEP family